MYAARLGETINYATSDLHGHPLRTLSCPREWLVGLRKTWRLGHWEVTLMLVEQYERGAFNRTTVFLLRKVTVESLNLVSVCPYAFGCASYLLAIR